MHEVLAAAMHICSCHNQTQLFVCRTHLKPPFPEACRQHIKEVLAPDCTKSLLRGGQALRTVLLARGSQGMNNNSLHADPEVVKGNHWAAFQKKNFQGLQGKLLVRAVVSH